MTDRKIKVMRNDTRQPLTLVYTETLADGESSFDKYCTADDLLQRVLKRISVLDLTTPETPVAFKSATEHPGYTERTALVSTVSLWTPEINTEVANVKWLEGPYGFYTFDNKVPKLAAMLLLHNNSISTRNSQGGTTTYKIGPAKPDRNDSSKTIRFVNREDT